MAGNRGLIWALAVVLLSLGARSTSAQEVSDRELAQQDEIDALKQQLALVIDEVSSLRTQLAVPEEEVGITGFSGLAPGASRVYGIRRGLSLGGYAEAVYRNQISDADGNGDDMTDMLRTVLYVGYKFTDQILFNTEIEFEHAGSGGGGSVSVELATLDYLYRDELSLRAGLLLVPMGFLNEIHEPPFFLGTQRPTPERTIIPSTWRENGVGIFGEFGEGLLQYRAYVVNGFNAEGFRSDGLRGGRQKGSRAKANDFAFVGRVDYQPTPGLFVGGSYFFGDSGQDQDFTQPVGGATVRLPDVATRIWEVHGEWRRGPFWTRALWTQAHLDDAGALTSALQLPVDQPVASRMVGGYAEVAYDALQLLAPGTEKELSLFFRFEYTDTQNKIPSGFLRDRSQPRRLFIPGIQFKPIPHVVLKLDYRNIENWDGDSADELGIGFGLVF